MPVKGDLGSITRNEASGSDGIPYELFKILKEDAVKVLGRVVKLKEVPERGDICILNS